MCTSAGRIRPSGVVLRSCIVKIDLESQESSRTRPRRGVGSHDMTLGRIAGLVGLALGVMVANVAMTVLYMVVYGHVIDRGHEKAYYDAHVQVAAPYCSIVAGAPLMFFAGLWAGGIWGVERAVPSALIIWATYAVIDLVIVVASGLTFRMCVLVAVSLLTKLAAAYGGALVARSQAG